MSISARLYDITFQKTIVFILITVRTSTPKMLSHAESWSSALNFLVHILQMQNKNSLKTNCFLSKKV
jgi:hypothetical protein